MYVTTLKFTANCTRMTIRSYCASTTKEWRSAVDVVKRSRRSAASDRNSSSPTSISTCKEASLRRNVYSWRSEIFITTAKRRAYYHAIHTLIGNIFVNSDCCRRDTRNVIRCCRLICSMHPYRVGLRVCVCVCLWVWNKICLFDTRLFYLSIHDIQFGRT